MLIRYKKSYEKIAMGLLSFIPSEKEIKLLLQTVQKYEEDESWQLFLWKDDEDILGVVGVHLTSEHEAVIEHISVNPSYRAEGVGKQMILALRQFIGEHVHLAPSQAIKSYFNKCFQEGEEKETNS
ncbi:GNAT family N-acetyltransferase [Sporolactobacillus terrae]|uniref:N-acetyltransferase n=1 Tax=Sporolactobacillus terrae TaxID=269673 RepID=A0A410D996_9BACL|nr:GNAT family N-acetyltransferase [Sporolactobacillus terrae]QAA22649.1 N-acetyltransferase [Sporolactobacillus terrae]QAA25623.1 N-acetyltransferase [Sporolactobacillus terrae]UAK17433.1 GNAT family N-acetyltransferase [Sporolactobacillus terrae]BBN98977.1 protein RibT [Sporolactobacillus terrae]